MLTLHTQRFSATLPALGVHQVPFSSGASASSSSVSASAKPVQFSGWLSNWLASILSLFFPTPSTSDDDDLSSDPDGPIHYKIEGEELAEHKRKRTEFLNRTKDN